MDVRERFAHETSVLTRSVSVCVQIDESGDTHMPLSRAELQQLNWRKASLSMNNGDCVEVARAPGFVAIRDSKDPDGAILSCLSGSFRLFLETVKSDALRP